MILAIAVLFAVCFIVFLVVADEIVQGESIVRSNEVDARVGSSSIMLIKIRAARKSVSDLVDAAFVASPVTAHRVAIFAVPLRPKHGKISNLVTAFAYIPRFCD